MSKLRFSDGIEVETGGPHRVIELRDGWYVTGRGLLCPCDSEEEAVEFCNRLRRSDERRLRREKTKS